MKNAQYWVEYLVGNTYEGNKKLEKERILTVQKFALSDNKLRALKKGKKPESR